MKWTLIIGNVAVAGCLVLLGGMAAAAHRTHAYSTYRELVRQDVLVERPDYDVAQRLETIAAGGAYSQWLAWLGAGACLANAVLIATCFPGRVPDA